jgi:hypothetical protein
MTFLSKNVTLVSQQLTKTPRPPQSSTAMIDMTGRIFDLKLPDSTRNPPSEEEDQDDNLSARSDKEATQSITLSHQKKKTPLLKNWRIWNHENKMVFLFFVIMLVFLALTLHAKSKYQQIA